MLEVQAIETFHGASQVLFGASLAVSDGEVATLLGRNGMGKTTTIRSIMGLTPARRGAIMLDGAPIHHLPSYQIARRGIGLVPEGRQIFPNLTVRENIIAFAANHRKSPRPYDLDHIIEIFPRLGERLDHLGNQLSGGEQQMLAVGRALMINPRLLILDEATEGLAPLVRKEIWRGMAILKAKGLAILIVDKNIGALMRLADRHFIMEKGKVAWSGSTAELLQTPELSNRYLGV